MCVVSVLMPVYNAEKYLQLAIDSVLNQRFSDFEFIIINDGSTDRSKEIILSYDDNRIRYIENETNLKLISTLNLGLTLCRGKYIARMDADDVANEFRLQKQVAFLESRPDCLLLGTNAYVIDEQNKIIGKIIQPSSNDKLQISLLFTNPFLHPSVMIRKSVLVRLEYNEKAIHTEDYFLWTEIAEQGSIANLQECLLNYRWHDSNVSVQGNTVQENFKEEIIRKQLEKLKLFNISEDELKLHRYSFSLYQYGKKKNSVDVDLSQLKDWYKRLLLQNEQYEVYNQKVFITFLWIRWIIVCVHKKHYFQVLSPNFVGFQPIVFLNLLKELYYLWKK